MACENTATEAEAEEALRSPVDPLKLAMDLAAVEVLQQDIADRL